MGSRFDRREFLQTASAGLIAAGGMLPVCRAQDKVMQPKTYTFKKVGSLEIQADVYRPEGTNGSVPVAMWIHGGALIMGNQQGVGKRLLDLLLGAGIAVVSIDYRLAPETKLPSILEDVQDAFLWVREKGPDLFGVETNRIVVLGGSAGGYLTLTTGYRVEPRPAALVAFWGYGDLVGDWYSRPSEFYRKQPIVSREEALKGVGKEPLTDGSTGGKGRQQFYLHCRQHGTWPKEVAGLDPEKENRAFDPFSPVRNVTKVYPPTLLIHGTEDTDVPYEQSVLMEKEFVRHSVEHKLVTVPGAGHGLSNGDPKLVTAAYDEAATWVRRFVKPEK